MIFELLTRQYPGMRIWLSQRITAVVMVFYLVLLTIALLVVQPSGYEAWCAFARSGLFSIATLFFFLCLSVHAWVGVRDVLRDYVFNQTLRHYIQIIVDVLLVIYLGWLCMIFWGN